MGSAAEKKWPKKFPPLTPEQKSISDDFMHYWHEVLPRKYGVVDEFNQSYVVKTAPRKFLTTLEIGAGIGEHIKYEKLTDEQKKNYHALDLRQNMVDEIKAQFPEVNAFVGDAQQQLNFEDGYFDRILAIHVLEHLPDLPSAAKEMYRLCNKKWGVFQIVIPCEGSFAYSLARRISAQRIFESRYKQSYQWFIEREHINVPDEILEELKAYFTIESMTYFPLPIPMKTFNLCIGANLVPRKNV